MGSCRKILSLSFMILSMFTVTTYASSADYEADVVNSVAVGDVQISISGHDSSIQAVVPNQKINKTIRINNIANPAWVRIKLEYESSDGVYGLKDNSVVVSSKGWEKQGDYYYYTKPVESEGYVDLCNSITIPADWESSYAGKRFEVIITAEAVQEKNFSPDFDSSDPWFGTVIETSMHSRYNNAAVTGGQSFHVVFEDGTQGLVRTGDDFFSNFGNMMPGDMVTDTVRIANNYSKSVEIYFRTDSVLDSKLLSLMQLEVKLGDSVLCKGALNSDNLRKGVSLGTYIKGSSGNLTYTLSMPSDAGNEYAQEAAEVRWVFYNSLSAGKTNASGGGDSGEDSKDPTNPTEKVTEPSIEESTAVLEEEFIKIPDELIEILEGIDDDRLKFYLDKEYLTEKEWQELISLLKDLGVPLDKWTPYLPKTGDDFKMQIYLLVLSVSLLAAGTLYRSQLAK